MTRRPDRAVCQPALGPPLRVPATPAWMAGATHAVAWGVRGLALAWGVGQCLDAWTGRSTGSSGVLALIALALWFWATWGAARVPWSRRPQVLHRLETPVQHGAKARTAWFVWRAGPPPGRGAALHLRVLLDTGGPLWVLLTQPGGARLLWLPAAALPPDVRWRLLASPRVTDA